MAFSEVFAQSLANKSRTLRAFESLLEPSSKAGLQELARHSAALTRRHFGKTMRLFAPLYLSNECINSCAYCGFSRENAIQRVTLEVDQVEKEARHLVAEGFRNILLVAGEHPKFVSGEYLAQCILRLRTFVPGISVEVAPMETDGYRPLVDAGAEGLVVYQETYHRETYRAMHLHGPKKDFDWRLDTAERGDMAGFRRIGIGALFGLWNWREEALALAAHLEHLQRVCWQSQITVSMPRLRPAAGEFEPRHPLPDREFIQLLCALRVTFPTVGIVVSTRESQALRDIVAPLGVTMMSAGSHTEPGGYTGQGREALHLTVRGKPVIGSGGTAATEQFAISDERDAKTMGRTLARMGLEPVWKDWDAGILVDA
ncbi:MAG: 2-iminoacetate synthase ThiH [Chthoniobacterales bacterium]|nr:2-iminoacetate synthase ThiH [Chthoniobacterales bacterium]